MHAPFQLDRSYAPGFEEWHSPKRNLSYNYFVPITLEVNVRISPERPVSECGGGRGPACLSQQEPACTEREDRERDCNKDVIYIIKLQSRNGSLNSLEAWWAVPVSHR